MVRELPQHQFEHSSFPKPSNPQAFHSILRQLDEFFRSRVVAALRERRAGESSRKSQFDAAAIIGPTKGPEHGLYISSELSNAKGRSWKSLPSVLFRQGWRGPGGFKSVFRQKPVRWKHAKPAARNCSQHSPLGVFWVGVRVGFRARAPAGRHSFLT